MMKGHGYPSKQNNQAGGREQVPAGIDTEASLPPADLNIRSNMSPIAYALFTNLTCRPEGANVVLEELVEALRSSKTAIRAAFAELAELNYLTYTQET